MSKLEAMACPAPIRLIALCCLFCGPVAVCAAQSSYTPPPPPLTTLPPCPVPQDAKAAKKIARRKDCDPTNRPSPPAAAPVPADPTAPPSATQKFPYPGDQLAKPNDASAGAQTVPVPGDATAAPAAPTASAAKRFPYPGDSAPASPAATESPAKRFPFPGDSSAAAASTPSAAAPAAAQGASSSSSSDEDAASPEAPAGRLPANDDDDDGPPKLADKGSEGKRNKKTVKPQTDSDRVDEDLSVAKYYGQSGNPMGAYLRAKDAVKTEPELPEARFVMGEAARRLNKRDEAKAEFGEYLRLAPDGEHAKAAERALSDLR